MKKYIDCDGVILDTETGLFDTYNELKKYNPNLRKTSYLKELDWEDWIRQAKVLNNAIDILKEYDPKEADILTKVYSLEEAKAKIEFFREKKVKNNIIIVPDGMSKSDVAYAFSNLLVDDNACNLEDFKNAGGYVLGYGDILDYPSITSLEEVLNPKLLEKKLGIK